MPPARSSPRPTLRGDFAFVALERGSARLRRRRPDTLNPIPARSRAAITPQTTAIMPVHCYGHRDVGCHRAHRGHLQPQGDLRRGPRLWRPGCRRQRAQPRRHVGAELPCHQGLQHLRGGAIICKDAKTKQRAGPSEELWLCGRSDGGRAGHQRQDERVQCGARLAAIAVRRCVEPARAG